MDLGEMLFWGGLAGFALGLWDFFCNPDPDRDEKETF